MFRASPQTLVEYAVRRLVSSRYSADVEYS